jgi:non-specific serine/threonine protein kinase
LFRRLAAFSGGAGVAEIEAIAAADPPVNDPIGVLETLVDRSLVTARHAAGGEDRFTLLQTIRTFGRELQREAGEEAAIGARHAAIFRELARRAEPEFYRASRRAWLERLAADHDNLRATLDELEAAGDLAGGMELAADLWRFWQQRGHLVEGRQRIDDLLAAAAAPGAPAVGPFVRSRLEEAAGSIRYWTTTDRETTRPFYERSLELAKESGDSDREAWAMYNLAFVYDFTPSPQLGGANMQQATDLRTTALAIFRKLADRRGIAESLWAMGGNALIMYTDPEHARRMLDEAVPALEDVGDLMAWAWAHISLGMLHAIQGRLDEAETFVLRAGDMFTRDGDVAGEIVSVQALGALAVRRGDDVTGVRNGAAANAAAHAIGAELPRIPPIIEPIEEAEARLSEDDLRREREIGVALGATSILSTALAARAASRDEVSPTG